MISSDDAIDTRLCPLCGKPNQCVIADGGNTSAKACWCKSPQFPAVLLNKLPKNAKNRTCICQQCQQQHATAQ